jgi:hypothetical protein
MKIPLLTTSTKLLSAILDNREHVLNNSGGAVPEQQRPLYQLVSWIISANKDFKIPQNQKKIPKTLTLVSRAELRCLEQCE